MLPRFFRAIGSDSCLTERELSLIAEPHARADEAWKLYQRAFRGFTASSLDPQFHRLTHPATSIGTVRLGSNETALVVGTGPSLAAQIDTLQRLRRHVRIFTSPRGAEALASYGITPDLVLIEHQTALDAHHSARHSSDAGANVLTRCPLVAADWRTPRAMIASLAPSSLFVPASMPTWGLWPATAVAMAAEAGASRIALLGIDLGTADQPDPAQAPLRELIELLATLVTVATMDCGLGGAPKHGWEPAALEAIAGSQVSERLDTQLAPAPRMDKRARDARFALSQLAPVIVRAAHLREAALEARSNGDVPVRILQDGMNEILTWGQDQRLRVALQESLGVSFLPRFWRIGVDRSLGPALWRPLLLATHELTAQAGTLSAVIAGRRAGGPADRAA